MPVITLDFETYYAKDYTLKKMTNEEYIRDKRFETICCGIKEGTSPTRVIWANDLPSFFSSVDWSKTAVLAHHAHFDLAILNWHYGIKPALILDTISMAKPFFPSESVSLANMSVVLGLGEKGKELLNFEGKHLLEFTTNDRFLMERYCANDVELTYKIFRELEKKLPRSEIRVIDQLIREFTEPILEVDLEQARLEVQEEQEKLEALLLSVGLDSRETLSSNNKFAELLLSLGVDPPMKVSAKTGKETYAFAKSDEGFKQLAEHEDPVIQQLVQARLGSKSTIKATRSQRFVDIGQRGPLPSYSFYYGAHTGRPSGGDKLNLKNLPNKGRLRKAVVAPPGHVCVMRDLSQIEARMLAYVAGQDDVVQAFRDGVDPYCYSAGKIYGREIKKEKDKQERQVGKVVTLGCGYGLGSSNLQGQLRVGFLGMPPMVFDTSYVEALGVPLDLYTMDQWFLRSVKETYKPHLDYEEHLIHCAVTKFLVDSFRESNDAVVRLWKDCDRALGDIIGGYERFVGEHELFKTVETGLIMTPTGMPINYYSLSHEVTDRGRKEYRYLKREGSRMKPVGIYGGRMTENMIQAISYILIKHNKLELAKEFRVALDTYDEIVCVVPEEQAEYCFKRMGEVMNASPWWAPDLPLKSGGGWARSYGDCEK